MVLAEALSPKMANPCLENTSIPVNIGHCPFWIRNDAMQSDVYSPPNNWPVSLMSNVTTRTPRWPLLLAGWAFSYLGLGERNPMRWGHVQPTPPLPGLLCSVFTVQHRRGQWQKLADVTWLH